MLAHAYLQPFFEAEQNGLEGFLGSTISYLETDESDDPKDWISDMPFMAGEFEYLTQHPVYNFTPHPEWESCFGPVGDWLVGETRARLKKETQLKVKCKGRPDSVDGQALQEIMQVIVMYGQLSDMRNSILPFGDEPFWVRHYINENGICMCQGRRMSNSSIVEYRNPPESECLRTAKVVFFGREFIPATAQVSASFSLLDDGRVFYELVENASSAPEIPDIRSVLEIMHCMSARPNRVNGHPAPHPPLHLFTFILRKYFDYQFDDLAFEMNTSNPVYKNFIENGRIFTEETDLQDMLAPVEAQQELTYHELGWRDRDM